MNIKINKLMIIYAEKVLGHVTLAIDFSGQSIYCLFNE